jgi:hypothetical protein
VCDPFPPRTVRIHHERVVVVIHRLPEQDLAGRAERGLVFFKS